MYYFKYEGTFSISGFEVRKKTLSCKVLYTVPIWSSGWGLAALERKGVRITLSFNAAKLQTNAPVYIVIMSKLSL